MRIVADKEGSNPDMWQKAKRYINHFDRMKLPNPEYEGDDPNSDEAKILMKSPWYGLIQINCTTINRDFNPTMGQTKLFDFDPITYVC